MAWYVAFSLPSCPLYIRPLVGVRRPFKRPCPAPPHFFRILFQVSFSDTVLLTGKGTLARLNSTPTEKAAREAKLAGAVRTLLECIGEDPERDGLLKTPERYAKALLWMTKGYEERLNGMSARDELVVMRETDESVVLQT